MKTISTFALYLCLIFSSTTALAQMYKWVDEEGNISYSNQPPYNGAEQLDAPALSTMSAPATPKKTQSNSDAKKDDEEVKEVLSYDKLTITSPRNDVSIRENAGNFSVSFSIKPALDSAYGHYFSVSVDGKVTHKKLASTTASFTNFDRGTHKITVAVKNKKGKTLLRSKAVTIHLLRQSALQKRAR